MDTNHRTLLRSIDTTTTDILNELRSMIVRQEEPSPSTPSALIELLKRGFTYYGYRIDSVDKLWIATNRTFGDTHRSTNLVQLLMALDLIEEAR